MRITIIEERIMTMLLAKILVENGNWSDIVYESDVKAQISRDLLLAAY